MCDQKNFNEIRDGIKTVETRAASVRYQKMQSGDVLVFVCGKERIMKKIQRVRHFKNIAAMFKTIQLKNVFPALHSITDARKVYYSYPGYKEKIERFGLVALELV